MWKVLSQGIHMWNMKVLSLIILKLWPRLKFLSTDDDDDNDDARAMTIVSPDFRHGELKIHASDIFMVFYVCVDLPIYKLPPTTQTYLDWASVDSRVHLRCRAGRWIRRLYWWQVGIVTRLVISAATYWRLRSDVGRLLLATVARFVHPENIH